MIRLRLTSRFIASAVLAAGIGLLSRPTGALTMVHHTLPDLVALSERAVLVETIAAEPVDVEYEGGTIPATKYRFRVLESFKGPLVEGGEFELRQLGSRDARTPGSERARMLARQLEMPHYDQGSRFVLFLGPDSPRTGLNSPVGLGQGAFREQRLFAEDGEAFFLNGYSNAGLMQGIEGREVTFMADTPAARVATMSLDKRTESIVERKAGPLEANAFRELVGDLVAADRTAKPKRR